MLVLNYGYRYEVLQYVSRTVPFGYLGGSPSTSRTIGLTVTKMTSPQAPAGRVTYYRYSPNLHISRHLLSMIKWL